MWDQGLSVISRFYCKIERVLCRAAQTQKSYLQVTQVKVTVDTKLKQKDTSLVKTKKKLEAFKKREESMCEMRHQLNDALVQVEDVTTGNLRAQER